MSTDNNASTNAPVHTIEEGSYANLVTKGKGYANNPRWLPVQDGDDALYVRINAQSGKASKNRQTGRVSFSTVPFDCKVVGDELIDVFAGLMEEYDFSYDSKTRPTIKLGFNIGDVFPTSYEKTRGPNKGKTVLVMKGRLFHVEWMYVNGDLVYGQSGAPAQAPEQTEAPASVQPESTETENNSDAVGSNEESAPSLEATLFDEELDDVVMLNLDDPRFHDQTSFLNDNGYRCNRDETIWVAPEKKAA